MRNWLIGLASLGIMLLYLLAIASGATSKLADYYWLLFGLNTLLLLGLVLLIARQVWLIRRNVKARVFGSKLSLRLVTMFSTVAVIPGLLLFAMSAQFLNRSIESWFNVKVEVALDRGLDLGRTALNSLLNDLARRSVTAAQELADAPLGTQAARLSRLRLQMGVDELALFDGQNRLVGLASARHDARPPPPPTAAMLSQFDTDQGWNAIEPARQGGGLVLRVAVPVRPFGWGDAQLLLVSQPAPAQLTADAELVEQTRADYRRLALTRDGLKEFYILTLTLTLLLALMAAVGLGMVLSRRLSAPLMALAAGTRAVAQGDFSRRHPIYRRDELGILTAMFNRMTRQLADAKTAEESARAEIEANKAYLESILGNLTSGVLAFDAELKLSAANPSAERILGVDLDALGTAPLTEWLIWRPELEPLVGTLYRHLDLPDSDDWEQQIEYRDGKLLLARGARLPDAGGFVVVFDDVTELVRAQRDAAWGEVAKRLAHEIRNPLTPIQLSAERLAMKLAPKLEKDSDVDFLNRATDTITKQVAALKGMVDAFRDYARAPATRLEPLDLNALVREVLTLYESNPAVHASLHPVPLRILGDTTLLRQVLHNLVVNAQDATLDGLEPMIEIRTLCDKNAAVIEVSDNGPGFGPDILPRAFEPYVTSKAKGTGLGLAVVKKIIEEHHGSIAASNIEPHGAQLRVLLPLSEA